MSTAKRSVIPAGAWNRLSVQRGQDACLFAAKAGARKVFRATAGLTIDQQLQVASQLKAEGDDVLKTIRQMKKASKNQKQTTKANNLKFEWLQEHSHLKKLEENCSKDLESMLLRMYNDASTARESKKLEPQDTPSKRSCSTSRSARDRQEIDDDNNGDEKDNNSTPSATSLVSTSTIYAAELEDLIRAEQLNRIGMIKQITSEREQRAALKQLLSVFLKGEGTDAHPEQNNQMLAEDMQADVRQLIYDAVIGRQMVEATLEEEVLSCEKEFDACYRKVLERLRNDAKTVPASADNLDAQEQKIREVFDATGGNECLDEMLRIEMLEAFRNVFAEFRHDLAQYEKDFVSAASSTDAAGSVEAATSKSGGWSDTDEERFLKVLRSYEKKHGTGKKPQLLYDQITLVLPTIPVPDIKKHVRFHQHLRFYQDKRKDRQRELQRGLEVLQSEAATKFGIAIEQEQQRLQKLQQFSVMQEQCEQRHDLVSKWRVTKEAKERIERQQREIEAILEAQLQQEEALRWKRKHDQQKLAVDEYKKDKVLRKMADEKLSIEEEQQREAERALQSAVNVERVQYRHHEFQRKLEDMKLEELHKAQLEEQRLAQLNELKEKTPYAQIIANIAPDFERTRQETAAFRSNVEAAQEGLPLNETGLFPSHGYDCNTLFKNARFKLGIALRNAGLSSSEYARQALANIKVCNVGAYRNHVAEPTKLW
ncbi:hypothetical protein PF005_g14912 [Phytophthora fragariae]|uniref:Coiled-coil domain-containing protein n=1 Tax=Phytophthora fragariae TaxID=53985 RepID=A0A6A3YKD4_9STRA|nr:hypothetical protein PF003_g4108 [Phytophthora fragariae]KAE8933733.1 hypothetical protein PF009_g16262 [Phytophthora fragariae]KAE9001299.1 hypothetical protein PF011_g13806 [Phytophthora fragariae]KAE9101331.1 hypothetical protein PF007_g15181 [Phytophthora fragariae]KAE9110359.1 hypothetical protein PF010_g11192 [Phytophthora fragariae]